MDNFEVTAPRIIRATKAEDIFGRLTGSATEQKRTAKVLFRQLFSIVNPTLTMTAAQKPLASEALRILQELWKQAEEKIDDGTYGQTTVATTITTKSHTYQVGQLISSGDVTDLYEVTFESGRTKRQAVLKVARSENDNDLVLNEARVLHILASGRQHERYSKYLMPLVESLGIQTAGNPTRQGNVLSLHPEIASAGELYSLKEVRDQYPNGLDPRDMAWICNRLLGMVSDVHRNKVIHGALLPTHILVEPAKHALFLIDWKYAVQNPETSGERISALSSEYRSWYPKEVLSKQIPTPNVDLVMAARCMIYLMGGDPISGDMPRHIEREVQQFFLTIIHPRRTRLDAQQLLGQFLELIERVWGPRKFRLFTMPTRTM